uniref:Isoleucyl-tRNA synthetase n=1 Tax=Panagrolaimus davidi TaxID=227884 RepID=A0A914R019_9BILA
MDVWVDSGVAWHTIGEGKIANCVSEGIDQFRGWFQSLLLTSLAARNLPPYKQIIVHGFSVDDKNRKMSKSVGNVIDPDWITDGTMNQKALGADGLRLWVALYGSEGTSDVKLGPQVLNELELKLKQIRNIYKFLLGALDGYSGEKPKDLRLLDKFILSETKQFAEKARNHYDNFRFRAAANEFIQFLHNPLSSIYVNCVRDRLYCDPMDSDSRLSALYTIDSIGRKLTDILSPILPHLATEYCIHHPLLKDQAHKAIRQQLSHEIPLFDDQNEKEILTLILNLRSSILEKAGNKFDMSKMGIEIKAAPVDYQKLLLIQSEEESFSSELTELFGCSYVKISKSEKDVSEVAVIDSPRKHCGRCRRLARFESDRFCDRCLIAIS